MLVSAFLVYPVTAGPQSKGRQGEGGQGNKVCASSCDGENCTFQGLLNSPLGDATLSINDSCQLVVDNIGGSGRDGVVQPQLGSLIMKTTLATPNFSSSGVGARAGIRQVGIVGSQPNQEIMLTRVVNFNGTHIRHTIDCSFLRVTGYLIEIYNGNDLVQHQDLGIDPPFLIYPKEDLLSIECGILPNGDVYTEFKLGSPQPITVLRSLTDPGPFTGDRVFVLAIEPQDFPTLQTDIENVFFQTGPITIDSEVILLQ